jgi:hypothetical protein
MRRNPSKTAAIGSFIGSVLGVASGIMDFFNPHKSKVGAGLQVAAYSNYVAGDLFLSKVSEKEHEVEHKLAQKLTDRALGVLLEHNKALPSADEAMHLASYLAQASHLHVAVIESALEQSLARRGLAQAA